jgi:thiosulfate/3-mercaptopyruvate sulfurtransferase
MYTTLIAAGELARHLQDPGWVVVDCRFTLTEPDNGRRAWESARIPGARYAHLDQDLSGPRGPGRGRHPLPAAASFLATLARWGIGDTTQVVVYDDSFGAIAVRLWWMLRWAGHARVALLDGGLPVWKRMGLPVDTHPPAPPPVAGTPCSTAVAAMRDELCVDAGFVERIRQDPAWRLIDARAEDRFAGEREPLDPVAGHIPGSINWNFEDNLALDGTWLPAGELRRQFEGLLAGVSPDHVVHSCGSGVTACHNLLAMEIAGLTGSRLYPGSWSEWISDPGRPVARGPA